MATPAVSHSPTSEPVSRFLPGYVEEGELAIMLGRTRRVLADERRARQHKFPFVKSGKTVLYRLAAVQAYLLRIEQTPLASRTPQIRKPHVNNLPSARKAAKP